MNLLFTASILFSALIITCIILWFFYFLRNPPPNIPKENNIILAPAEGKIVRIIHFKKIESQTVDKGFLGKIKLITNDVAKHGYLILIRLHVYNIHFQRSPIKGVIKQITYKRGKFLNAVKKPQTLQCLFENERNEILIKGDITCKIVQIAGYIARRIECFVKENQEVQKGEELGLINLGSQVALIIPKCSILVKEGQKIKVGETIIATTGKKTKLRRVEKV